MMVSEMLALPEQFLLSVAVTVKLNAPAAIGVPVIAPFVASDKPLGSDDPTASAKL
jgi:hypothetical protein